MTWQQQLFNAFKHALYSAGAVAIPVILVGMDDATVSAFFAQHFDARMALVATPIVHFVVVLVQNWLKSKDKLPAGL